MRDDKAIMDAYDNYAEKWTRLLRSGNNLAHRYLEKPAMYSKIPHLKGKTVLCIGCGSGDECKKLQRSGAKRVIGIDFSAGLIEIARKSYPDIEFHTMKMEKLDFPDNTFDFVYSSLTMHYLKDWTKTLKGINRVLKADGVFLFSTHHPVRWGFDVRRTTHGNIFKLGYESLASGECLIYGDYMNSRLVHDIWFDEFNIRFYHRPMSEIVKDIAESGFYLADLVEPRPLKGVISKDPEFYQIHCKIPLFMILELKKLK